MTKKHYIAIARILKAHSVNYDTMPDLINALCEYMQADNVNFKTGVFMRALK